MSDKKRCDRAIAEIVKKLAKAGNFEKATEIVLSMEEDSSYSALYWLL